MFRSTNLVLAAAAFAGFMASAALAGSSPATRPPLPNPAASPNDGYDIASSGCQMTEVKQAEKLPKGKLKVRITMAEDCA